MRRAAAAVACAAVLVAAAPAVAKPHVYVRAGALQLRPIVSSGEVALENVSGYAQLAVQEGPVAGSGSTFDPITTPALIIGYVLHAGGGHVAIETILALPLTLHLRATGTIADQSIASKVLGGVPTGVPALGPDLGTTKALPPIVTAVYRFRLGATFEPYVGGGLSYMHLYGGHISNAQLTAIDQPSLETQDTVAAVAQGGIEARFAHRYYVGLDVKLLATKIKATVHNVDVRTPKLPIFGSARVGDATVDMFSVPVVVFLGAGAEFEL